MKLVSYLKAGREQLAILTDGVLYDTTCLRIPGYPRTMREALKNWKECRTLLFHILMAEIARGYLEPAATFADATILAPVPRPNSCRDGYAFRQHVAAARRNRKLDMIPEFDQYPIFYFTNHRSVQGPGDIRVMPDHLKKLDFELEVAIVIGKKGRNIKAENADKHIAGYMIMNDMSARTLQMEEMLLNLGPAKGKDFSTVIGPILVTPDELKDFKTSPKENHIGNNYNLQMKCFVNGVQVSEGNMADMDWTFAEIIERASYGVDLYPGDVIGSGTVGTGCFLELNGTGKLHNPDYQEQWLQDGDIVEMTIDGLGTLKNTIVAEKTDWSILALKKK
jgi:fumarylacetoacetate (FAA) hydrolase